MSRMVDMTKGRPTRQMLLFALPLIAGNIGQQLYMVVDAVIVGPGVGVEALAAVGATDWMFPSRIRFPKPFYQTLLFQILKADIRNDNGKNKEDWRADGQRQKGEMEG